MRKAFLKPLDRNDKIQKRDWIRNKKSGQTTIRPDFYIANGAATKNEGNFIESCVSS
jgi:hypothetical protein